MKRTRSNEILPITIDQNEMFANPILRILALKLDDKSLSAMARSCRKLMRLCYFKIEQILKWGKNKSFFGESNVNFPNDQFLQMQVAKVILFAKCNPDESLYMDIELDPIKIIKQVEKAFSLFNNPEKIKHSFSMDFYMKEVCFTKPEDYLQIYGNRQINFGSPFLSRRLVDSLHIIKVDNLAKCLYYIENNNYQKYVNFCTKINDHYPIVYSIFSASAVETFDPRFVIFEINHLIKTNQIEDAESVICDVSGLMMDFYPFENPVIFHFLKNKKLLPLSDLIHGLVCESKNGKERCDRLIELGCIDNEDILDTMKDQETSFLNERMDSDDEESINLHYKNEKMGAWDHDIVGDINKMLQFEILKDRTLKRLNKIVPILEKIVKKNENEDEYYDMNEIYVKLKLILMNNT